MRTVVTISCGILLSMPSYSAETENKQTDETIVITLSRDEQPLSEVTRAVGIIDNAALEMENHSHIQQVFNQQPGVQFHRNSGQEYLAAIRSPVLTGAGACGEFLMLENGIPLRPSGMCNVNELFEAHHQLAESIEIVRGPATSVYGSNGLHGVVNITTPALPEGSGKTTLTLGSHEYVKLKQLNQFGNWNTGLTVINDGGFRDDSGFKQHMFTAKHARNTNNYDVNTWATLFNLDQETAGYLVGSDAYKDKKLITTNANPEAYRKGSGFRLYQTYQWQNGIKLSPYLRHSKMEFMQHFLPGQPIEENDQTSVGIQSSNVWQLNEASSVNYGVDAEYASINLLEYQDDPTSGSAFLQATIPVGKHYDYQVDSINIAAFVTGQWQVSKSTLINAGIRAEYNDFDYDNLMLAGRTDDTGNECGFGGCRFSRPDNRGDDFFNLSPQIGVTYSVTEHSQLYASYSHGFRAPQATELYRLQRQQTVADLNPVELEGIDGGWRFNNSDFAFNLSVYNYKKSNAIVRNTDYFNVSGGKSEHQGLEISAEYWLNEYYSIAANSSFSNHTYLNNPGISDQDIVGLDIDTSPNEMTNLFLKYQADTLQWQLHGLYVSDYFTDVENQHSYPGHVLVNASVRYQLNNSVELGATVHNLLDERYAERADFSGFSGDRYFPGRGRNINFSLAYNY